MGVLKYRESASAPWQELAVIGDIYTDSTRPVANIGISANTHEMITINQSKRDSATGNYTWLDWKDYIADLNSIEMITVYTDSMTGYMYIRGLMPDMVEGNKFPVLRIYRDTSVSATIIEDRADISYMQFDDNGVRISYTGTSFVSIGSKGAAILCIKKKEA